MVFPLVLFALCIALPAALFLSQPLHDDAGQVLPLITPLVAGGMALLLAWRIVALLRRGGGRPLDPARIRALAWPRRLSREQMERYSAEYLRSGGWVVVPVRAAASEATYLQASRDGVRRLLLCDAAGEELNPAIIRAFAVAAAEFGDVVPVVITRTEGRLPPPATLAAREAGVHLLKVAEFNALSSLTPAPTHQPAGTLQPAG